MGRQHIIAHESDHGCWKDLKGSESPDRMEEKGPSIGLCQEKQGQEKKEGRQPPVFGVFQNPDCDFESLDLRCEIGAWNRQPQTEDRYADTQEDVTKFSFFPVTRYDPSLNRKTNIITDFFNFWKCMP